MLLWTLGCIYLFYLEFPFFPDIYPEEELVHHTVPLFLFSLRTLHIVLHSGYTNLIPSKSVGGFYKGSIFNPYFTNKKIKVWRHSTQLKSPRWKVTHQHSLPVLGLTTCCLLFIFMGSFIQWLFKYKQKLQMGWMCFLVGKIKQPTGFSLTCWHIGCY